MYSMETGWQESSEKGNEDRDWRTMLFFVGVDVVDLRSSGIVSSEDLFADGRRRGEWRLNLTQGVVCEDHHELSTARVARFQMQRP